MYLEHFGLTEPPFRITPHTDFFFSGANRGATLEALIYAITHDEGIVRVTGEVGSGKTMLCRVLAERLPENVTIIYLANPSLSREDILYAIADEIDLPIPAEARASVVLRLLQNHLIVAFGEGRQTVVLIDEAHAMPTETLEEIRLLSNLESNRNKLLQLVLFGQPELNTILARPDMRQLKERITHNFMLEPLVRDDVASYIDHRMRAAGYKGPNVFDAQAIRAIASESLGLTRRINILADKSLLAAFANAQHQVGEKEVATASRDCDFSNSSIQRKSLDLRLSPLRLAMATGVLALTGAGVWLGEFRPATGSTPPGPPGLAAKPASETPAPPTPGAVPTPESALVTPAPSSPLATDASRLGPQNADLIERSQDWMDNAPGSRWFIQLFATDKTNAQQMERFIDTALAASVDVKHLRAYESALSGSPRLGLIYGDYPDSSSAQRAIQKLPAALRDKRPYPRQVIRLRPAPSP